jgi:hypothetical protein
MSQLTSLFEIRGIQEIVLLVFAILLLFILVVSFRSRSIVFCQYLKAMTGVELKPTQVKQVYREKGKDGVRELFLDLIIKEDLKTGPLQIPGPGASPKKKP